MRGKQHRPKREARKKPSGAKPTGDRVEAPEVAQYAPTNPEFALIPPPRPEDYADYVEHPRFGKAPRYTGFDPNPDSPEVNLHWRTGYRTEGQRRSEERWDAERERTHGRTFSIVEWVPVLIPGTAVEADLSRQTQAYFPVTHYYDLDRICTDCKRKFLFFAEEQKHWYEDLGFNLASDAVRCPDCRKRLQNIAQMRQRYEQLSDFDSMSVDETLEMADCCLTLIEAEAFSIRQCERVRMLLKRVPEERRSEEKFRDLTARVHSVEGRARGEKDAAPTDTSLPLPDKAAPEEEPNA